MILTAKRHKKWAALVLVGVAGVGWEIGSAINTNTAQIDTIREGAVKACEASLKPGGVRFILAQQIQAQSAQHIPAHFFPGIPPKVFRRLVREQRQRSKDEVRQLLGVNCEAQFPRP